MHEVTVVHGAGKGKFMWSGPEITVMIALGRKKCMPKSNAVSTRHTQIHEPSFNNIAFALKRQVYLPRTDGRQSSPTNPHSGTSGGGSVKIPQVSGEYTVTIYENTVKLHRESKKQDTKLLPITSPNVNRFSKFFRF